MRIERPVPFAVAVTACALLGTVVGAMMTVGMWGGRVDLSGLWVLLPTCLAAGAAASYVEHRARHRLGWAPDGKSRTLGPAAAAVAAYSLAFAVTSTVDIAVRTGDAAAAVNGFAFGLVLLWLLSLTGVAVAAVTLAFLVWLRRRRLAALAAAGLAPVTSVPPSAETDEDREVAAYLGRARQEPHAAAAAPDPTARRPATAQPTG